MAHSDLSAGNIETAHDNVVAAVGDSLQATTDATNIIQGLGGLVLDSFVPSIEDTLASLEPFIEEIALAAQESNAVIESVTQAIADYNQRADEYLITVQPSEPVAPGETFDPTTDPTFQDVNSQATTIYSTIDEIYNDLASGVSSVILDINPAPPVEAEITTSVAIDIRDKLVTASRTLSTATAEGPRAVLTKFSSATGNALFDSLAPLLTDLDDRLDPLNAVKQLTSTTDTSNKIAAYKDRVDQGVTTAQTGTDRIKNEIPGLVQDLNNLTF